MKKDAVDVRMDKWLANGVRQEGVESAGGASRPETLADLSLRLRTGLWQFGYDAALAAGDHRADPSRLESLRAHARGMAEQERVAEFDAKGSLADRLRLEEHEEARREIAEVKKQLALANEDVRRRKDGLAELGEAQKPPQNPFWLLLVAALLIGASLAPTFKDAFLRTMADQRLAWLLACLPGFLAGFLIGWCILGARRDVVAGKALHAVGLLGGLVLALGAAAIRLATVGGFAGWALAVGLCLIELGVVVLLEFATRWLRRQHLEWARHNEEYGRRERALRASEQEEAGRKEQLADLKRKADEFLRSVREQELRSRGGAGLVQIAQEAATDGYAAGLDEIAGRLRGTRYAGREVLS